MYNRDNETLNQILEDTEKNLKNPPEAEAPAEDGQSPEGKPYTLLELGGTPRPDILQKSRPRRAGMNFVGGILGIFGMILVGVGAGWRDYWLICLLLGMEGVFGLWTGLRYFLRAVRNKDPE